MKEIYNRPDVSVSLLNDADVLLVSGTITDNTVEDTDTGWSQLTPLTPRQ